MAKLVLIYIGEGANLIREYANKNILKSLFLYRILLSFLYLNTYIIIIVISYY